MTTENTTQAIIALNPSQDEKAVALYNEAQGLLKYAEGVVILGDATVKGATNDLSLIAKLKKALEERRKEYTTPVNAYLKQVNDAFKLFTAPLEQADTITRAKIMDYRREQERKAREAEEINRLRMEAARREMELKGELTEDVSLVETPPAPPAHVRADIGDMGTMKVWKFEVVDFAKLPDEYKMVDATKLGKVLRAGLHNIPGVRAWQEETLKVNTR
ncbi:MAG: hypothetical protein PHU08_00035 [Dehalococcoidales bacterium]|nr:hypothetical protein [Dehalococcoidales bacterium]